MSAEAITRLSVAQQDGRIDPRRTPRGSPGGKRGNSHEHQRGAGERRRIAWLEALHRASG